MRSNEHGASTRIEIKRDPVASNCVVLELPWPPSVNIYKNLGRTITTKRGKKYQQRVNSPATKQFYHTVWVRIRAAMATQGLKSFQGAKISLHVDAYPPDGRRRDIGNILKVLEDSLQRGGLFDDDFQICRLTVQRMGIIPEGKVIVTVKEILCT